MNCLSLVLISSGERTNARLELCLLNLHIAFLSIENQRHQLDPNDDLLVPPILFGPLLFHTVGSVKGGKVFFFHQKDMIYSRLMALIFYE